MMIIDTLVPTILVYLGTIYGLLTLVFFLALLKQDNSIMDIAYGATFALTALVLLVTHNEYTVLSVSVVGAITLWAIRLSGRIYRKNAGTPEDARYAAWRKEWMNRGRSYFILRSYFQIYILQGTVIAVVGLPALLAVAYATSYSLTLLVLGLLVFTIGLVYETLADWQLDRFLAKKRAGQIDDPLMRTGLFRYSRRPNYFGEATIWTGLALTTITTPLGWLSVASPMLITYIVTQVTGPMLEKIFLEKYPDEYRTYMQKTSYFIPWPPKAHASHADEE
jgi:steroid 5-alpha reductase family enzyme